MIFTKNYELALHIQNEHKDIIDTNEDVTKKFECCGENFISKPHLSDHIKSVHDEKKHPFKCTICESTFSLRKHVQR